MRRLLVMFVLACGCGDGSPEPSASHSGPPAQTTATAGPGDVEVARVAGRPVFGSCVVVQVARGARTRELALQQCIDFELLAQAAEARGLATAPEVIAETRRALVSRLVEVDFERRIAKPEDIAPEIEQALEANRDSMKRPELRASAFTRITLPANAPADADARARALAERIHAELAGETGLLKDHLGAVASRLAQGSGFVVETNVFRFSARGQTVPTFDAALFSIAEVGRVAAPIRTEWGWDVILLTDRLEEKTFTRDDVVPIIFGDLRRVQFERWVDGFMKAARIARDHSQLEPSGGGS